VPGQQAWIRAGLVGERFGETPVQEAPLGRENLGVDGLADQRVRKRVSVTGCGQQARIDPSASRGDQVRFGQVDGRGEQLVRHAPIGHRHLVGHRAGLSGERGCPGQDGVGDRGRRSARVRVRKLPGEQGVALRGGDHRRHVVRAGTGRHGPGDQPGDLCVGHAAESHAGHPRAVLQFGQPPSACVS
jgi:hypothetical protein